MAYLVKDTFTSAPRPCVLEGIISDHRQKLLAGEALVREERQDFWYSVAELIGETPTPQFRFVCPHCKGMIQSRKIDIGLQVKCAQCSQSAEVPDITIQRAAVLDTQTLRQANATLAGGALFLLIGATATLGTYMDAINRGGGNYGIYWGLIAFGGGMLLVGLNQRRSYFKKYPRSGQRQPAGKRA